MYLYFVHLKETSNPSIHATADQIETMAPEYRPAADWLRAAQAGDVILFPPQFILLYLASQFLDRVDQLEGSKEIYGAKTTAMDIVKRRRALYEFVTKPGQNGGPAWSEKFISPIGKGVQHDGRQALALGKPGPELKDSGLSGDEEYVVMVKFQKEGPRQLEVRRKSEVAEEGRKAKPEKL